jgi:hypothetical protein
MPRDQERRAFSVLRAQWSAHRDRVERLIFGGDAAGGGDAESPGSGGASPYLRRASHSTATL